tara:strand:- start:1301 stop:1903 length:603 start_codon:yes stop_codon:yes gene_type:complete
MKKKINIYSNIKIRDFLNQLCNEYQITFFDLNEVEKLKDTTNTNLIFLNNAKDLKLININNLKNEYLLCTSLKNFLPQSHKNCKFLTTPSTIAQIKNTMENFLENMKLQFHDISIFKEKITNINNNSFCYLTNIELNILTCLIKEKNITKNYIKQNILNIKTNLETNSIESHLTRIRKKMNKINTSLKIKSRNEKLLLSI